jgi:fructose-bisphosphate aldolase class I
MVVLSVFIRYAFSIAMVKITCLLELAEYDVPHQLRSLRAQRFNARLEVQWLDAHQSLITLSLTLWLPLQVDKGLVPLANSNGESWCQGLDGLAERCAEYYKAGARFAKWRSVVSIPAGPSIIAQRDCAYGLARYAAICQNAGLVPIVEPEVLLDGEHTIEQTLEVASATWAETFKYMADNKVMFEGILLKPAMVTPGADCPERANPDQVAEATLNMLRRRVPPAVPGIMFLSGGQSELEATLNLNAMNQSPNPWHVSFSYARALQNTVLKTWQGQDENRGAGQQALLRRAKANSDAQLGKYTPEGEDASAAQGMYEKGYTY